MHRSSDTPRTYRHRGHTIEALSTRVCGPEGWRYWLVCPDNGAASWYAHSLAETRETIAADELKKADKDTTTGGGLPQLELPKRLSVTEKRPKLGA